MWLSACRQLPVLAWGLFPLLPQIHVRKPGVTAAGMDGHELSPPAVACRGQVKLHAYFGMAQPAVEGPFRRAWLLGGCRVSKGYPAGTLL